MNQPISVRQNSPEMIKLLKAFSWHYRRSKRWHRVRVTGTLAFAAAAPVVTFWLPGAADWVAAIAGAWVLLGRTIILAVEDREVRMAVTIQEQFDTDLFGLVWNGTLAGAKAAPEDITDAARHVRTDDGLRDWYPKTEGLPRPMDVLLCQRASAVWGRRTHMDYATTLAVAAVGWFLAGLAMAVFAKLSLAGYLVKLFLPSQPAFLDAVDLYRTHRRQSEHKRAVERHADALWARACAGDIAIGDADCRAIQDEAYRLRRRGPQVAQWFYRFRRGRDELVMRQAAAELMTQFNGDPGETITHPEPSA